MTLAMPKDNQYGGQKGCSTSQVLVDLFDKITEDLEDNRAATVLTAIDYSKAYNRLEHSAVLRALRDHGASNRILKLIGSFLIGRERTVRIGNSWSHTRTVNAKAPQGSVLGTYLFNIGTDFPDSTRRGYSGNGDTTTDSRCTNFDTF